MAVAQKRGVIYRGYPCRAIVRIYEKRFTVLCPNGHVIDGGTFTREFGGSQLEAELGSWQAGASNRWDRLAKACAEKEVKDDYDV